MDEGTITLDRIIVIGIYLLFLLTNRHIFFNCIYTGLFAFNVYLIIKNKYSIKLKSLILYAFIYLFSYFFIKDPNPFYYLLTFYLPMPNFFRAIFIIIFISYFFNNHIFKEDINNKENNENKEIIEIKENVLKKENEKDNKEEPQNEEEEKLVKNESIIKKENEEKKESEINEENKENEIKIKKKTKRICFLSREIKDLWGDKSNFLYFLFLLILLRLAIYFYDLKYWIYFTNQEKLLSFNKNHTNSNNTDEKTVYYISAVVYNMEPIIKDWIEEMKQLINYLGHQNVIV